MASPTWWTCVWVNSSSWWWTGRPGVLRFMGSQRVGHDWATELNWFHCTQTPQLLYPFFCQRTFRLLLCLDACKQCSNEHWDACILSDHVFLQVYAQELQPTFLTITLCCLLSYRSSYIYLVVLGLSCGMWDLVPWLGIEPWLPALGMQSHSHWTTGKSPHCLLKEKFLHESLCSRRTQNEGKIF